MNRLFFLCPIALFVNVLLSVNVMHESRQLFHASGIKHEQSDLRFSEEKEWTILIYFAADNDLGYFAVRNLMQLLRIGSNDNINIVVELDIRTKQGKKLSLRYYIKKNTLLLLNSNTSEKIVDSGKPDTLINFCADAIGRFPAKHYMVVLWSHGTGALDPAYINGKHLFQLFTFNNQNKLYELNRDIPFMEYVSIPDYHETTGICFDDTTKHYMTNNDLQYAFNAIQKKILRGKKIDIVAFDACLMSMLEIAHIVKPHARYMVASQEVEIALSYDYFAMLKPFASQKMNTAFFVQWIIKTFEGAYKKLTKDYTLSALDLSDLEAVENNLARVAELCIKGLKVKGNVKNIITVSRHKFLCTHFSEPSYIDLHHFYKNVLSNINRLRLDDKKIEKKIKNELEQELSQGLDLIEKCVVANTVGPSLQHARGISLYFPIRGLHKSYLESNFAKHHVWIKFLKTYLMS